MYGRYFYNSCEIDVIIVFNINCCNYELCLIKVINDWFGVDLCVGDMKIFEWIVIC